MKSIYNVAVVHVHPWDFPPASTSFNQATWHCAGIGLEMDLGSGWLYLWGSEVSRSIGTLPKLQPWVSSPSATASQRSEEKKKHFLIAIRWLNICWLPRSLQYFAGGNAGSVAYFGKISYKGSGKRRNEGAEQGWQMGTERNMTKRGWHFSAYK